MLQVSAPAMAQFQDLTRCLLAAGGATHPEGNRTYLLYTDHSSLISKHWNGSAFGDQELITADVRANSSASMILTLSTRLIICISSASTLLAFHYDEDDEEWAEDTGIPRFEVHPVGRLAVSSSEDGRISIFFQDAAGRLIHLDDSWAATILPASPLEGSPISTVIVDGKTHAMYISAEDHCMHDLSETTNGSWSDEVMVGCKLEQKAMRFMVSQNAESRALEAYVLTEAREVLQVIAHEGGMTRELGKVDKEGNFVAGTSAECCRFIWLPILMLSFRIDVRLFERRAICW